MEKTIRMPKELLEKWLAALRSGEYKQCRDSMTKEGGFCCLGVLVEVSGESAAADEHPGVPSSDWLKRHRVLFGDGDQNNPKLPTLGTSAAMANDKGKSFAEIADAIEACAEGV